MRSGWRPGDLVLGPGILVLAIFPGDPEQALLLISGRPRDVWLITDSSNDPERFRFKWSQDSGPDFLIFHPKHCKVET